MSSLFGVLKYFSNILHLSAELGNDNLLTDLYFPLPHEVHKVIRITFSVNHLAFRDGKRKKTSAKALKLSASEIHICKLRY